MKYIKAMRFKKFYLLIISILFPLQALYGNDNVERFTWEFKGEKVWKLPSVIRVAEKKYWVVYKKFDSADGYPDNPVFDYVELPSIPDKYTLVQGQCFFEGGYDELLFAYVVVDIAIKEWRDVYVAYSINDDTGKIVSLDATNVFCLNDEWET